jgi:protocatechuate 3,4-dioxygenase beta subunit
MSMSFSKYLVGLAVAIALTACGGGGGSAGNVGSTATNVNSTGTVTEVVTTIQVAKPSMTLDVLSGAGVSTNSISASEISTVAVVLKDSAGVAVPGTVVAFAESGGSLLSVAPASKTALTDASGKASVEIRAATTSSVGATTISASAQVSGALVTAQKSIAITSAPGGGAVIDPQSLANAMNFLDVNPADKSIVLAGSGGNGRSESATLRFRVVDKNNTPVKGAAVTFDVIPVNSVTLNIPSAVSDADGVVVTTVSSKSFATAVVVRGTVTRANSSTITSQSDQLLVTTGSAVPRGFDLSASKYNLNWDLSGDLSKITVRIVDTNGNPVADGVPVVFTADFGAVGSSARGGCVTLNGSCAVDYTVQDPRPADGQFATVIVSTQIGDGTSISQSLQFRFSNPNLLNVFQNGTGALQPTFAFVGSCQKQIFSAFAGTPAGFPAPAGTAIEVSPVTPEFTASLKFGSPVLDRAGGRTLLDFELDASPITGPGACVPTGGRSATAAFNVKFTAGATIVIKRIFVTYPVL